MQYQELEIRTPVVDFQTLVWGEKGEPIVLLHGFPETPFIFESLAEQLVAKGYQVFAPFLPGYGNSSPVSSTTSITQLEDIAEAIGAFLLKLSDGKTSVKLVGHDWGAVAAYVTAAKYPHRVKQLVTLAVPPLPLFLKGLMKSPTQWFRSSYMFLFQFRVLPEVLASSHDHFFLRKLCSQWSGSVTKSQAYFSAKKEPFKALGSLSHPLGYYRGLLPVLSGSINKWIASQQLAFTTIKVPTNIMVGSEDGCIPAPLYIGYEACVEAPSSLTIVENAGHFLPLDAPEAVAEVL